MVGQVDLNKRWRESVTAAWFLRIMALLCVVLSCSSCAWIDAQQRLLIYRPSTEKAPDHYVVRPGDRYYFVDLPAASTAQRLSFWWMPNAKPQAPTLLYFHGTFRDLYGNRRKLQALRDAGFSVLGVDYRGWGESSVLVPSEKSILQDADVAWNELKKLQPLSNQRVIYGHSMGSGVAVDLASRLNPSDYGGLVLESAFTSFNDVAREAGLLAQFLNLFNAEHFDSLSKITRIHAPLLMLHGDLDTTIPIQLGAHLYAAANSPKQWIALTGASHSDLDKINPTLYQSSLHDFTDTYLGGSASLAVTKGAPQAPAAAAP
jgi:pimeloyl-ACP methyl ester carboxylesterase